MKEKVVIGIPSGGSVHTRFMMSLLKLQQWESQNPNDRYELVDVFGRAGLYIQENRNNLVKDAQERKADWLLQLDPDHSFDPNFLQIIMRDAKKGGKEAIFGLYSNIGTIRHNGSFDVIDCIYRETEDGKYQNISIKDNAQIVEVDAAGTGLFLSHLSIYDRIPYPWFWVMLFQNDDGTEQMMNEDLSFCRFARSNGIRLWCDPLAEAHHHKTVPLLPSTMRSFLQNVNEQKVAMGANIGPKLEIRK